jgi:poly(3-hydroxyalkanoate) synthetase
MFILPFSLIINLYYVAPILDEQNKVKISSQVRHPVFIIAYMNSKLGENC